MEDYVRGEEVQNRFMESGFRAGIYVDQSDVLTPPWGLDLRQPQKFFGRASANEARAMLENWDNLAMTVDQER